MSPLSLEEPWAALLCPLQLAPGNWPESSAFVLIETSQLVISHKEVERIHVVTKDVIRRDIDSELLPSSLCSTLFFLSEVQAEKRWNREN